MRFKLLSSIFFIGFLAATALCANWDNQQSLNADQLISGGEEEIITPPAGQAATPKIARELQKNKSSLDWSMPSTLSGGEESAKESRTQAESASLKTAIDTAAKETVPFANTTATAETELPPAQTTETSVEGSWLLTLNDSAKRDLALALFQTGDDVFGSGKIKEGNSTMDVSASGTVSNETLKLNLVSANPIIHYKVNLNLSEDWASGEFQATTAIGESWTGSVEGQKTA